MNKLWYEIKKLGFMQIDTKCSLCKKSLENFKKHPMKINEAIVIMPHVNTYGNITHYHIGRIDKNKIQETKIYEDLEKE